MIHTQRGLYPPKSIIQRYTRSPTSTVALLTVATTEKWPITLRQVKLWDDVALMYGELVKCYPWQPQGWSLKAPSLSEVSETEGDKTISCPSEEK